MPHPLIVDQERTLNISIREYGLHHPSTRAARTNLAITYRRFGFDDLARSLFDIPTDICPDLAPVEAYIRSQGVNVYEIHSSTGARTSVFFENVVLNARALKKRFSLADWVEAYSFRDIKYGAEQGLLCRRHKDALIGAYPDERRLKVIR